MSLTYRRFLTNSVWGLVILSVCGCGKPPGTPAPQGKLPGGGTSGPANAAKSRTTQPGQPGQPVNPQVFVNEIVGNQRKVTAAHKSFAAVADHYRQDPRRFSGDMVAGVRNYGNELRGASDELSQLRQPPTPEGKAFYEAYRQMLDNQIKAWDTEGQKLAQDPGQAKAFDDFLTRIQQQQNADMAKVKETQQAFVNSAP